MRRFKVSWLIFALAVLPLASAACRSGTTPDDTHGDVAQGTRVVLDGGTYTNVTPGELKSMLPNKDFPLVNVHIPYQGEIPGTNAFIPFDRIDGHLDKLPPNRDSTVFLYCRSGTMSVAAAESLVSLGYTDVWNLDGGMIAWEAAGYELIRSDPANQ